MASSIDLKNEVTEIVSPKFRPIITRFYEKKSLNDLRRYQTNFFFILTF